MGGPQPAPLLTLLNPSTAAAYTAAGFWGDQTIYHLAARQARAMPQAFALRDRDRRLSYPELVDAADRLAAHLAGHGIRPGNHVAHFPAGWHKPGAPGGRGAMAKEILCGFGVDVDER